MIRKKDAEDNLKNTFKRLSTEMTRLQKGIDRPRAVFREEGEKHYSVTIEVGVARGGPKEG